MNMAEVNMAEQSSPPRISIGLNKLADGSQTLDAALMQLDETHSPEESERQARDALKTLRSAVDWLEDTEHFEHAHKVLDESGRRVRTAFGCQLSFDPERGYGQTCPVALAHNRIGMSATMLLEAIECTICGADPEDCHHIAGRSYGDKICGRLVTKARILEVSLVSRPNQPDARIHYISVPYSDLRELLGSEFQYGMTVSCDKCLQDCNGVNEQDPQEV